MAYDSNRVCNMCCRSFDLINIRYKKSWIPEGLYKNIDSLLLSRHKAQSVKKKNMHYVLKYYMLDGENCSAAIASLRIMSLYLYVVFDEVIKWNQIAAGRALPCQESTLPCQENSVDLTH